MRWSLDTDGLPSCHREARDGKILVGTSSGWVLRVGERSGQVVEQVQVSRQVNDVVEPQGLVHSATGQALRYDAFTGELGWQHSFDAHVQAGPVVVRGQLVVSDTSGTVYSLNAESGAVRWTKDVTTAVPTTAHWAARPVMGNKAVFVGYGDMQTSSTNGDLYAIMR
ncbi:PQQ-binding-like beta-propeller repeat protein [Lentzea guizhouensis]|uniref:outer membrane protein assembly factor BamB family protein n=1 Tax=Lentzea guizhouensis TaxID=1586287 RepID=UPI001474BBFB|nr:PQQ-binding-like beta-propeller repeat protein [Lentzea guizhouensis]